MKNRRLILPSILALIVLTAILLFLLSKNELAHSMQAESTDHTVGFIESTSSYPVEDSTVPEEENTMEDTAVQNPPALETMAPPPLPTKDEFFADALFIGDSRTMGLQNYAELETATFFAYSGLSSFSVFKKTLDVPGLGETTLETLLTTQHYGKIYLMLGINELGYRFERVEAQYNEILEQIKGAQGEAKIYLCANLHVTKEQSEKDCIFNNKNINRVNQMIEASADNERTYYLDVNVLFDDEEGNLSTDYSSDSFHVLGRYYTNWVDWIRQQD